MAGLNKVIKFSSQQSGAFNEINNIVTFNIPADGSYDLSSSYVELNCRMSAGAQETTDAGGGTAVYIPELAWYNTPYQVNNSMFVRRAMLRTTRQGVLEDSLRRDILSSNLVNYTHTSEELSSLGYKSGTQHMNYDGVVSSIWRSLNQGGASAGDAQSSRASTARSAPITIPLDQLLSLGMARQIPFGAMGGGQLELELNASITNSLADGNPVGWSTLTGPSIAATSAAIDNVPSSTFAYGNSHAHPVVLTKKFVDRVEFPLFVGANVAIEAAGGTGAVTAGAANLVIEKIWFDADGTANLVMDQAVANLTAHTLTGMTIAFLGAATPPLLTIDSANLVMKRIATPQPIQPQMTYLAWETEEYSQAGSTQLNHTFRLPANCMNALIMLPAGPGASFDAPGSGISKLDDLATYRLSINNRPIVNRDVNVTDGIRNCLHYELLMRSFEAGSIPLRNMQEIQRLQPGTIAEQVAGQNTTGRDSDIIIIGVPTEETAMPKSLQVDLRTQGTEAAALLTNLVVFKQVVRTITI